MVGAGSSLVSKDALAKGDWGAISATARQFVDIVKAARAK
jgi:2-keto-3-deoxy-6-phosphogluconate aldolase